MLYDYATDRLDAERKSAVDEFLKQDKECREILEGIHKAIAYSERLAETEVSTEVQTHLKESENIVSLGRRYSSWKEWPDVMRWAIVCMLLVISIAGVVSAVPWKRLSALRQQKQSDTIEVATLQGPNSDQVFSNQEMSEADAAAAAVEGSGDEEMEGSNDGAGDEGAEAHAPPPPTPSPSPAKPVKATPTPTAVAAVPSSAPAPTPEPATKKDSKTKGFVYRAFMNLTNLDEIGPKITSDIEQMGGEKAGEVELGWKRGTGRYYHFAMPESNEEKLLERLRAYGPVRISKDPHPRIMPQGQVRFILWVESTGN